MTKLANGRAIEVTLVAGDSIGDVKYIKSRLCRIVSKKGDTRGVIAFDGVVSATKNTSSDDAEEWDMLEKLYWDATNNRLTTLAGSHEFAGYAVETRTKDHTTGKFLLNGLPALWGD